MSRIRAYRTKILIGLAFLAVPFAVWAAQESFGGFAWSDTVGFLSFDCRTGGNSHTNVCGTSNYGVTLDSDTNLISGWAWSSGAGWIKFGGLSGAPADASATTGQARKSGSRIVGWARACEGSAPGDCSTSASRSDWDGWISLSGSTYGVTISGSTLRGYAWGGDPIGWVSFDGVSLSCTSAPTNPVCTDDHTVSFRDSVCTDHVTDCAVTYGPGTKCGVINGTAQCVVANGCLSVNADVRQTGINCAPTVEVRPGDMATLYWKVANASSCSIVGTGGQSWTGLGASGSHSTGRISAKTTFTLTCLPASGAAYVGTAVINMIATFKEI